jgi:hypothetical protein
MGKRLLLVAGIPASGKSSYCRWLATNFNYRHLDVDLESVGNTSFDLGFEIESMRRSPENAVLDWGFPMSWLAVVTDLSTRGFEYWWFDGDRRAARQAFLQRRMLGTHNATLDDFERQMKDIEANWELIEPVFRGRIIHTIMAGPTYLAYEQILETMAL